MDTNYSSNWNDNTELKNSLREAFSKEEQEDKTSWNERLYFGGKISNFENDNERSYFTKMMKYYLKGKRYFNYGFSVKDGKLEPNVYEVQRSSTQVL